MKLYIFVHFLCTGIYAGIQAGHASVELVRKYKEDLDVRTWADVDKTVVLLNGGVTKNMHHIKRLVKETTALPWAEFREPDAGNMVTAVAVVVPDDWKPSPGVAGRKFYDTLMGSKLAK